MEYVLLVKVTTVDCANIAKINQNSVDLAKRKKAVSRDSAML